MTQEERDDICCCCCTGECMEWDEPEHWAEEVSDPTPPEKKQPRCPGGCGKYALTFYDLVLHCEPCFDRKLAADCEEGGE